MACEHCAESLASGDNFCRNCGDRTNAVTVASVSMEVSDLKTKLEVLTTAQIGKEQKYLDVETTEMVVERLKKWSTYFAWFAGVPVALLLITLSIFAGKTYTNFTDIVRDGKNEVATLLGQAKRDSGAAVSQAKGALVTSQEVNRQVQVADNDIKSVSAQVQDNTSKVNQLGKSIEDEQAAVKTLNGQIQSQQKSLLNISHQVESLNQSKIVQEINDQHPEFGVHVVESQAGEILSKSAKQPGTIYAQIDVVEKNPVKPHFTSAGIAEGLKALSNNHFKPFFGYVGLFAGSARSTAGLEVFNISSCQKVGLGTPDNYQGLPCIVYFYESDKANAFKARDLLSKIQRVPDDRVRYVPVFRLNDGLREIVESSGLDMAIVLGP